MPTIKDFGGYKVTLYAEDHNPPHVHVIGPDFQAKVRIADSNVFAGALPPRRGVCRACLSSGSRHLRVFLVQPAAFRKGRVADLGGGIKWATGFEYGGDPLMVTAEEQRPMGGADLAAFEPNLDLSPAETAA